MSWKNCTYIDTVLPFGLRAAPPIFNAVTDALEWILLKAGTTDLLHYFDNFLTMVFPAAVECANTLHIMKTNCHALGLLLKHEKVEGPSPQDWYS